MFKIVLSNTKDTIPIRTLDEVKRILERISAGDSYIVCQNGVFNPSYLVAIIPDPERARNLAEAKNLGYNEIESSSPFAKLLSPKMEMLPPKERTKAQEEASREERKLKR